MKEKQKKLFIIIGIVAIIATILLIVALTNKKSNDNNIDSDISKIVKEDVKKDNEKGIALSNLNSSFKTTLEAKTKPFKYNFNLNGEKETLIFETVLLNSKKSPAKLVMYLDNKKIDVMEIIKKTIVMEPTSIIPKFYLLGDKKDEVLLLEVSTTDEPVSNVYIAFDNDGEVRNFFGGFDNQKVSDDDFLKEIKNGRLVYDHKISNLDDSTYCNCQAKKDKGWLNKVISENQTFSVLEASLKLENHTLYECKAYCK